MQTLELSRESVRVHRDNRLSDAGEFLAFCPKCKTLETLWFSGEVLVQTRKFRQESGQIYHDCGSDEPCRLYCSL